MERIVMRPIGSTPDIVCWHCSRTIDRELAIHAARYIYRGEQPFSAVIEDWVECVCGAYQNSRVMAEIRVEALGKGA
jgi:hypothetical protein